MFFFNFFQTLVEKNAQVTVELKNDLEITGTLHSVDQYLNIKLSNISANNTDKYPHLAIKNCFIRGSVVRYVYINKKDIDFDELQDLCRKSTKQQ
ncbi:U6 snRNA-associated Sm-like protein LSm2 [Babesia microti strain RI]|uniref:U6 snRNA-associated Sm-like protein LSm2 n=1 Tax=Babesia microti (strain RI) TaxID=1133968 RepID=A0A1N6LY75_BABMR|nr:U6 snRNA-associated Sm-like protein LSm2 [Babesia microti strain RI]SIO73828.1 U6 snRNA-associated Sm-like protein LSm2 [Babesia microti strain RI]|eukprot:XP_021337884.1 U6 snRNA-associated Sm-like protein LSm2 [Babesia microti strain RI]